MTFKKPTQSEVISGIAFILVIAICLGLTVYYSKTDHKISAAWFFAAIVGSQVSIDLGKFSSPESKAKLSAAYRILGGLFALGYAYLS